MLYLLKQYFTGNPSSIFSLKVSVQYLQICDIRVIPFFLPKISNKMCYKVHILTVDAAINFKIYLQTTSNAMADREKKRGRHKYKNFNISRIKRAFDKIKNILHSF